MKLCYKILIVIAFLPLIIYSQTYQVYKESFDAGDFETLDLDLNNSSVVIEKSNDNRIHFDFSIQFNNYTKKEIESILKNANITSEIDGNQLNFKAGSDNFFSGTALSFQNGLVLELNKNEKSTDTSKVNRKSKEDILALIKLSKKNSVENFLKRHKEIDENGNKKNIDINEVKMIKTNYYIKVPDRLDYVISADDSNIKFDLDLSSVVKIVSEDSSFKFKAISNPSNSITLNNGKISIQALKGGNYFFDNVREVRIAELDSVTIQSEFSDLEIGEIGKKVSIEDFNSKFWIHNFHQNFGLFKMNMEYSELNLFYPENSDYSLTTYGHTTKHIHDNINFETPPSRDNTSSKMLASGDEKNASNTIDITSEHSIIRLGDDFIDLKQ